MVFKFKTSFGMLKIDYDLSCSGSVRIQAIRNPKGSLFQPPDDIQIAIIDAIYDEIEKDEPRVDE